MDAPTRRARGLVIAWMPVSQRSHTLAERLGYELVLVGRGGFRRPWLAPFAYPWSAVRTVGAIVRRRPRAAIVIAPPFLAGLVAWPFLAALRAPFAIDIHSGALLDRRWRWSIPALRWVARRAAASVVTLESLRTAIDPDPVRTLVIPDPLPNLPSRSEAHHHRALGETPIVVAICGWGLDEPIEALIAAARGRDWRLIVTGRPRRSLDLPPNVTLAGFLEPDAFAATILGADAVVVLTTRDETLLSGAWEAIATGRPLVLSRTDALVATFGEGLAYVDADPEAIATGIEATLADAAATDRVHELRERFQLANDAALDALASRLATRS